LPFLLTTNISDDQSPQLISAAPKLFFLLPSLADFPPCHSGQFRCANHLCIPGEKEKKERMIERKKEDILKDEKE
jgi:hypothetical protein